MTKSTRENLMPIGRFAASCRLSIKALRHYDEQKLLIPAYIDPNTGYRYYQRDQAHTAVAIGMLRSLDFTIPMIKELLQADPPTVESILDQQAEQLTRELAHKKQALASVRRLQREKSLLSRDVKFRTEPARRVFASTIETRIEDMLEDSTVATMELVDAVSKVATDAPDFVMCINEMPDQDGVLNIHVCSSVVDSEVPDVRLLELDATPVAWCLHQGAYEELGLAYHAVFAAIQVHGHEQVGAMREVYLNDPANTPVEQLLTEVIIPIG